MKVKLLNTTSKKCKNAIKRIFNYQYGLGHIRLEDAEDSHLGIVTSTVLSIEKTEDRIYVETKNSHYELEILKNDNI